MLFPLFSGCAPFPPSPCAARARVPVLTRARQLLTRIKMLTGIVEVGLFCHMAKAAYFGNQDGSVTMKWHDGRTEKVDGAA